MMNQKEIVIIGGGLAGCEAAWQAANRDCRVRLYDMKPKKFSPAHQSANLAELVCSNSLRASDTASAVGLLKEEMRRLDSLIMRSAAATAVPAGRALAVDRELFAAAVTREIEGHPLIEVVREEIGKLPEATGSPVILATGPLTSGTMAESVSRLTGREGLSFYDAIAPIVLAESLDMNIIYQRSRYDEGPGDYLNCPMDRETYRVFVTELSQGDYMPLKEFEEARYFEGCLPIEVMCARGDNTLRFGPMKPVGLPDPRTGRDPYAVVQLRKENLAGTHYNMVGFQTKLTYSAQKRIFRLIPGMVNAEFARMGSIHRNTFVCAPEVLEPSLQMKARPDLLLAGQLSGVEGYVESTAMGILAGINAARILQKRPAVVPPPDTAMGALVSHLTRSDPRHFQPSNVNFGLFPACDLQVPKKQRGQIRSEIALASLTAWLATLAL
ncbi:MAG: methylenetetrahydrofolate--tRNA-(uracil(54)-C(5))-methyltransferase (FADH(2)-oxidizing) TrmFO [Desulfocapsaceae bacterium]|nr:methylenetetrahydrofolate--tRNA-(uracil(54)-C(5))-methyltransferase (FADH(2)-oxidizing) TrmFO [Desulfocapsaceae bacterium]